MQDCIFCKIVAGQLPSYKVYEDEDFLGFLDIYPRVKGHTVFIPKIHYRWVYDVPQFDKYWLVALKITQTMQKTLHPTFVSYVTHGLEIPHAHIHIMPRYKETEFIPEVKKIPDEEMKLIAEKIRSGF